MKITRAGLDLAKRVFQMHGVDDLGRALQPRRRTIPPSSRMRESIAKAESSDTPAMTADSPGLRTKAVSLVA